MKTAWVTLHCKDQTILDTVVCAVYVEDEEAVDEFEAEAAKINDESEAVQYASADAAQPTAPKQETMQENFIYKLVECSTT